MNRISNVVSRLYNSAVLWSWTFNAFRAAFGLMVLPLLWWQLPESDLGMYYVLLRIAALVPIIDFGFSVSVARNVSYAMGGATELQAQGVARIESSSAAPNLDLLWKLLFTYRYFYRYLSVAAFLFLAIFGTYNVAINVHETRVLWQTWIAWGMTLTAATVEIYFGWWNVYLRGMNQVLTAARLAVLGYAVQLVLACSLLLGGGGLISVPLATLAGAALQRSLSRRRCLKHLGRPASRPSTTDIKSMLILLWPNTWRVGLKFLSISVGITAPQLIFAAIYGVTAYAAFGMSHQVITVCMSMAAAWTAVKWPLIGQLRAHGDHSGIQRVLWSRMWLQSFSYILLALGAIHLAPALLGWISPEKRMLSYPLLLALGIYGFLELQFAFWTTLLSTENRVPSLWPTVATNFFGLLIFLGWLLMARIGETALVFAPLLAGSLFNYWYWPMAGARNIGAHWFRFMFKRP